MMAALEFVPRVAPGAIVPSTCGFDDFQAFIWKTLIDEVGGYVVFDAGPHFIRVWEGVLGASSVRPRTQQESRFVIQRVDPLARLVTGQVASEIVLVNGGERLSHAICW